MGRYCTALLWPGFVRILGCFLYTPLHEFEIHRLQWLRLIREFGEKRVIPAAQIKLQKIIGSHLQICQISNQRRFPFIFAYIKPHFVKATGVILLLGVGSFVCYKLFKKYKRKLSSCWKSRKRRKISRTNSNDECETLSFFGTQFQVNRKYYMSDDDSCSGYSESDFTNSRATSVASGELSGYSTDTESSDVDVDMGNLHTHLEPVFYNVHSGVQFGNIKSCNYNVNNRQSPVLSKSDIFRTQSFEILNIPEKMRRPRTLNVRPVVVNDQSDETITDSNFEDEYVDMQISPSNLEQNSYQSHGRKEPDGLSDSLTFSPISFPSSPLFRDSDSCQDSAPELESPRFKSRKRLNDSMIANFSPSSLYEKHFKAGIFDFQGDSTTDQEFYNERLSLTRDQSYDSLSSEIIDFSAKEDKEIGTYTTSSLDRIQRELHQVKEDVLDLDLDIVHLKLRKRVAPVEAPTKSVSLPDVSLTEEMTLNKFVSNAMYIFHRHRTRLHQKGLLDIPKFVPRAHSVGPLGNERVFYSDMDHISGTDGEVSGSLLTIPTSESDFTDEFCLVEDKMWTPQTDPESSDWNRENSFGSYLRFRRRHARHQGFPSPGYMSDVCDTRSPSSGSRYSDEPSCDEPIGIYIEDSIEFDISDTGSKSSKVVSDEENALEWDEEFEHFLSGKTAQTEDTSSFSTISQESIVLKTNNSEENIIYHCDDDSKIQDILSQSDEDASPTDHQVEQVGLLQPEQMQSDCEWTTPQDHGLSELETSSSCDNVKNGNIVRDSSSSEQSSPVDNHCNQAAAMSVTCYNVEEKCHIIEYAERQWSGVGSKSEIILKGYSEIPQLFGCTCLRRIRKDNYCILRAALYQVFRQEIPVFSQFNHDSSFVMEQLHEYFSGKNLWLNEWTFSNRLTYFKENILFTMQDCIQTLHHVSQQLSTKDEDSFLLEDVFNLQPEIDVKLMEAVKLMMLLHLKQLLSDSLRGKSVPNFILKLLAKEISPEMFMKKYLNHVGESSAVDHKILSLLGHTFGVTLKVIRPVQYNKDNYSVCYPDDDIGLWQEILLILEDDGHFSVAVP